MICSPTSDRPRSTFGLAAVAAVVLTCVCSAPAFAAPQWELASLANTTAAPGSTLQYSIQVLNVGTTPANAGESPVTFTANLPAGLSATEALDPNGTFAWTCTTTPSTVTCVDSSDSFLHGGLPSDLTVNATVDAGASGTLTSHFDITGGGAAPASTVDPTAITPIAPAFGIDAFDAQTTSDAAGNPATQAGGHPYAAITSIDFNTVQNSNEFIGFAWPVQATKDVVVDLPPGFIGDPTGADTCTSEELAAFPGDKPHCPPSSQVGITVARVNGFGGDNNIGPVGVYNMVPPPGVPARFGFNVEGNIVTLDAHLRTGGDYGVTADVTNVPEGLPIAGTTLTLWGDPADPSHDPQRLCPGQIGPWLGGPSCTTGVPERAFLRNPTSCTPAGSGLPTTAHVDSWGNPGRLNTDGSPDLSDPAWVSTTFTSHLPPGYPAPPADQGSAQGTSGCEHVPFTPSLEVQPTSTLPDSPTGLSVHLAVPQTALSEPQAVSQADVRRVAVTLPEGMTVNPSQAQGLQACTAAQIAIHSSADPSCPDASNVGSVEVETPLLAKPLKGSVYVAAQSENPFGTLLAIYIVAKGSGVTVKLPGRIDLDPTTGRLTTTVDDAPQTPFSSFTLHFDSGPRAPLVNPSTCGQKTISSTIEGWNGKSVSLSSGFDVQCTAGLGTFAPAFTAGTVNNQAGAFTPFTMTLSRQDGEQRLSKIALTTPAGLAGVVAGVPRCAEAQANAGTCDPSSLIGHTTVGAGAGSNPFYVGGSVYFTGPYHGAPFGLSIVTHAVAGPFDLGLVVVRAAISADPHTAQLTVTSDPLPTILQGIPLDLRNVNVTIDRPGFIFNPTGCEAHAVTASVSSTQGTTVPVSSRFQPANCATLPFHPSFIVSTSGKTSKAGGAGLHVQVATKEGPSAGSSAAGEANIAKVEVQLPAVLPSRLTTLQKACTAAQFERDPAGCPQGSFVGTAVAHTPILSSPLSGPAILVSHGGQAFPDLVLVLQGEGVRIDLTGHTQIKKGITFSRFETVPDAPVSSFDLTLPEGPHGVLTTDKPGTRNLCATTKTVTSTRRVTRRVKGRTRKVTVKANKTVPAPLSMPTTMTAQNGAVIHQNTKIAVTGCAKTVRHERKKAHQKRRKE